MPAPILHFEYSLFSKLSKPAAGVLARGSSFIAGQIAELTAQQARRIPWAQNFKRGIDNRRAQTRLHIGSTLKGSFVALKL